MTQPVVKIHAANEDETCNLAADFALALTRGDCICLDGELGAGKSTFARALIRTVAGSQTIDVPSPTFTLVQTYELRMVVSHFDLYRLDHEDELDELGLDDALELGAALIEWPSRAGNNLPSGRVNVKISGTGDSRDFEISGPGLFMDRLARSREVRQFLDDNGLSGTRRRFLMGDASSRRYELVGDGDLILMDSPKMPDGPPVRDGLPYSQIAHLAEDVRPFVAIADWLRGHGFSAPAVPASSLDQGLLLVEHLGQDTILDAHGVPVAERYLAAIDCLAALHEIDPPDTMVLPDGSTYSLPHYDANAMQIEVELLTDWYLPFKTGDLTGKTGNVTAENIKSGYISLWQQLFTELADAPKALVLRDYHSPNLLWRADQRGLNRIGIIDFQDGMIGPQAYDVASLVQDARVTISPALAENLLARYESLRTADNPQFDRKAFRKFYAIMAAQRAAKILGIFVRLDKRDGKPGYLKHLPRIEAYLTTALSHDALEPLRSWFAGIDMGSTKS